MQARQRVYDILTGEDQGLACKDIPEQACSEQPHNFLTGLLVPIREAGGVAAAAADRRRGGRGPGRAARPRDCFAAGLFGIVDQLFGEVAILLPFTLMCVAAVWMAAGLEEVQRD